MPELIVPAARPPRRTLSRAARRRLDRLSRSAHRFHRFAHHPLCDRYAGEVVRIGTRTRLCRGCTYAVLGGASGGIAGLLAGGSATLAAASLLAGAAVLLATLYGPRRSKLITRLLPAALFACAMTTGVLATSLAGIGLAVGVVACAGGFRLLYGRRGADRAPCTTCPENGQSPCSGFRAIVSRERAVQRVARSIIS